MSSSKALTKVVAVFDAIIVRPLEEEETTFGSIIVPDMGKEKHITGDVISVGPGRFTVMGNHIPMQLKVGDLVVLPTQGFTKLPFDGEEYYVGPENQVLAKVQQTVEGVLAETEITNEDKENLTDI